MDLVECAKRELSPSRESELNPEWAVYDIASAPKSAASKKCVLATEEKTKMAVFQFYDSGKVAEQFCTAPYSCEGDPQVKNVACSPIVSGGTKNCPSLGACLDKQFPMPDAYTDAQLKKLAEKNPAREKALRAELARPASVASSKLPGDAVSSTSFQPRTANIAGSRTSVSNPPASKPPASGHTGRGMK